MNKPKINQHLRSKISALMVIAGLAAGVLFASPKAEANPQPVSGTWNLCGHNMWDTLRPAGRNFTIDVHQNQIFFGPMVGTLYITPGDPEFDVIRFAADHQTLIRVHFHGSGTFVGSALGRTASPQAVMGYHGQIAPDGSGLATWWLAIRLRVFMVREHLLVTLLIPTRARATAITLLAPTPGRSSLPNNSLS